MGESALHRALLTADFDALMLNIQETLFCKMRFWHSSVISYSLSLRNPRKKSSDMDKFEGLKLSIWDLLKT